MTAILSAALFRGVFFLMFTTFLVWVVKRWNHQILSSALLYRRLWATVLAGSVISAVVPLFFQISIPLTLRDRADETGLVAKTSRSLIKLGDSSLSTATLSTSKAQEDDVHRKPMIHTPLFKKIIPIDEKHIGKISNVPPISFIGEQISRQIEPALVSENTAAVNEQANSPTDQNANVQETYPWPQTVQTTAMSSDRSSARPAAQTSGGQSSPQQLAQVASTMIPQSFSSESNEQISTEYNNNDKHKNTVFSALMLGVKYWIYQWIVPSLLVVWICGVCAIFAWRLFLFTQISRLMRQTLETDCFTQQKWENLLREHGVASDRIALRMHETIGPALARTPRGLVLLLPESLWLELDESLQVGVLRHELAHYLHRDTLYTPLFFGIASLQWFNPCAWYALRQYSVAVEWCCDEFAYGNEVDGAALLAETFLRIHQTAVTQVVSTVGSRFAKFGPLDRVNRLLNASSTTGSGKMKQYAIIATLMAIFVTVFMCFVLRFVPATPSFASETESVVASNDTSSTESDGKSPSQGTLANGQPTYDQSVQATMSNGANLVALNGVMLNGPATNGSQSPTTAMLNPLAASQNEFLPFPTVPVKQVTSPQKFVVSPAEQQPLTLDEQTVRIDEQVSSLSQDISLEDKRNRIVGLLGPKSVNPEEWENRIGMKFRRIPAGEFVMGLPATKEEPENRYSRQHLVTLTQPFYMGVYEMTRGECNAIIGLNKWSKSPEDMSADAENRLPMICSSMDDAKKLIQMLNVAYQLELEKQFGVGAEYVLPTEAQWEYACRAGTTTPYYFGSELNGTQANCNGRKPYGTSDIGPYCNRPMPVGSYAPNAWGLYDMHGNMTEWCQDDWQEYPKAPVIDPVSPRPSVLVSWITRGGSWKDMAEYCRSGARGRHAGGDSCGIRVAIRIPKALQWQPSENVMRQYLEANRQHPISWTNDGGMNFRLIPTGKSAAVPASTKGDRNLFDVASVQADHPYYLGTFEVTQRQWETLMGKNPSYFSRQTLGEHWEYDSSDFPVELVNLKDCEAFVTQMNAVYGEELREMFGEKARYTLPTISQWTYACRACTDTAYYWGDMRPILALGNLPNAQASRTCRVGLYQPNPWGLYDMFGNVAEICWTDAQKLHYDQSQHLRSEREEKIPSLSEFAVGFTPQFGQKWIEDGGYQEQKAEKRDAIFEEPVKRLDTVWSCGSDWRSTDIHESCYGKPEWRVPDTSFAYVPGPSLGLRLAITLDETQTDANTPSQTSNTASYVAADTTHTTTDGTTDGTANATDASTDAIAPLVGVTIADIPPTEIIDLDSKDAISPPTWMVQNEQQQRQRIQRQLQARERKRLRDALSAGNMEENLAVLLKQFDPMFDEQLANQSDEYKDNLRHLIVSLAKRFGERPAKIGVTCRKARISQDLILENQYEIPVRSWTQYVERQKQNTEKESSDTSAESTPSQEVYFWSMYSETIQSAKDLFVIVNGEVVAVHLSLAYGGPTLDYVPQDVFGSRIQKAGGFYAVSTPEFPMELAEAIRNISTLRVLKMDDSLPLLPEMLKPISQLTQLENLTIGGSTFYFTRRRVEDGEQKDKNAGWTAEDWQPLTQLQNLRSFVHSGNAGHGEILPVLAELPHLETVRLLQLTDVTREQFESLNRCSELQSIDIPHLQIHPDVDALSLENLSHVKNIRVDFWGTPSNRPLRLTFRELPALTEIDLKRQSPKSSAVQGINTVDTSSPTTLCLESVPRLQRMHLQNIDHMECDSLSEVSALCIVTKLPDELAKRILNPQQMPNLRSLMLMRNGPEPIPVTDNFLCQFRNLPLETLLLAQLDLNEQALQAIAQLPNLYSISMDNCLFDTKESCVEPLAAFANSPTLKRASITSNRWKEANATAREGTAILDGKPIATSELSAIVQNLPALESLTVSPSPSPTRNAMLLKNLPALEQLRLTKGEFAEGTDASILEKFSQYDPKKIQEREAQSEAQRRGLIYPWSVDLDFIEPPVHEWTEEENAAITQQQTAADETHPIQWKNKLQMSFQLIPSGDFVMGVNDTERQAFEMGEKSLNPATVVGERPKNPRLYQTKSGSPSIDLPQYSYRVHITRPFYMGTYEVTQREWKTIMGDNPSRFQIRKKDPTNQPNDLVQKQILQSNPDQFPVENISWAMARQFVSRMNVVYQMELEELFGIGAKYVLPTEAQWEYACRAGTTTAFHFGNTPTSRFINMNDGVQEFQCSKAVGSYLPNAWGLYDCHGNVEEWCADWFGEFPEETGVEWTDPTGPFDGTGRVLRGGSMYESPFANRSAFRHEWKQQSSNGDTGLRLAIYVPPKSNDAAQQAIVQQRSAVTDTRPIEWKNAFGIPFRLIPADTSFTVESAVDVTEYTVADTTNTYRGALGKNVTAEDQTVSQAIISMEADGLDEPFYMAQYELTLRTFLSFVNTTHYQTTATEKQSATVFQKGEWHIAGGYDWQHPGFEQRDHMPVVCVSRQDAEAFVTWLNRVASDELYKNFGPNARYALPTVAQWQYVFSAGGESHTSFAAKPSEIVKYGNLLDHGAIQTVGIPADKVKIDDILGDDLFAYTSPVGRFAPSPWGIYDLYGNVREWCTAGQGGSQCVISGSGWSDTVAEAGQRRPQLADATCRQSDVGFRLVILHPAPQNPKTLWTSEEEAAMANQKAAVSESHPIEWKNSTGIDFRLIPSGEFISKQIEMKNPSEYLPGKPRHVVLTQPFYMGTFEVTRDTWKKVMGENDPALREPINPLTERMVEDIPDVSFESGVGNFRRVTTDPLQDSLEPYPMTGISWEGVQKFVSRLNEQDREALVRQFGEGAEYVLPTEAQWEYACRAGTTTVFYFGDRCNGQEANCNGSRPYGTDVPGSNLTYMTKVGSYAPNAWGLYDCHGNAAEWCNDWFDINGWQDETTDPNGPDTGEMKITRGGHFSAFPIACSSAYRVNAVAPNDRMNVVGFRLAIRLPKQ